MFKYSYIVLLAVGMMMATSCEKNEENLMQTANNSAHEKQSNRISGGDDDEDDFIIQVKVVNEGVGTPILGATVDHFRSGGSTPDQTDTTNSQGLVSFSVSAGDYFEKVSASGFPVFTSPTFTARDTLIVIEL